VTPGGFARALSADTRRRIVELIVSESSYREAASILEVTPAAVYKYVSGRAVPRDDVTVRAVEELVARDPLAVEIVESDLLGVVHDYIVWALERGVLTAEFLDRLERLIARARLVKVASGQR